jgi:3-hydroxyisobutyrate dehydrogenase
MMSVAFIGAGQMGGRLARRLMAAGFLVTICDKSASVQESFRREGAGIAQTPEECAKADIVIIFVMDGPQAIEAVSGPHGLSRGLGGGAHAPLVIVMSTILPSEVMQIAGLLKGTGASIVDAPVTGVLSKAEQGTLTILAGGEPSDLDKAEAVFEHMGTAQRCGKLGSGETCKIINNMMGVTTLHLSCEAFRLAQACGMMPTHIAALLEKGPGTTFWSRNPDAALGQYDDLSRDADYFATVLKASAKDWGLAISLGKDAGVELPFLDAMIGRALDVDSATVRRNWRSLAELKK